MRNSTQSDDLLTKRQAIDVRQHSVLPRYFACEAQVVFSYSPQGFHVEVVFWFQN